MEVKNDLLVSGLWGLVNNAGIAGPIGPVEWLRIEDYQKVSCINIDTSH